MYQQIFEGGERATYQCTAVAPVFIGGGLYLFKKEKTAILTNPRRLPFLDAAIQLYFYPAYNRALAHQATAYVGAQAWFRYLCYIWE
jgi:hypothetical protein